MRTLLALLVLTFAAPAAATAPENPPMAQKDLDLTQSLGFTGDGEEPNAQKIQDNFTELYADKVKFAAVTKTYADMAAGAGAQTFDIFTATEDELILDRGVAVDEEFAGGSLSEVVAAIGHDVGPDPDAYAEETSVFTGAGAGPLAMAAGADLVDATRQSVLGTGQKAQLTLTPTGDDLENATAGSVTGWVLYRKLG